MTIDSAKPIIYLITKGEATENNFPAALDEILETVRSAVNREISFVQIREKTLSARSLFKLTEQAAAITRTTKTRLLVNGRADVALAAGADGVHLTGLSVSAGVIRASFPAGFVIGVSTHSVDEAVAAKKLGADFAVYGPVFESPGKGPAKGIVELAKVCAAVPGFLVLGLGGVDDTNCDQIISAGAAGFAAIRWLNEGSSRE